MILTSESRYMGNTEARKRYKTASAVQPNVPSLLVFYSVFRTLQPLSVRLLIRRKDASLNWKRSPVLYPTNKRAW